MPERKQSSFLYSRTSFTDICYSLPDHHHSAMKLPSGTRHHWWLFNIGLCNGLVPSDKQVITWQNGDADLYHYKALQWIMKFIDKILCSLTGQCRHGGFKCIGVNKRHIISNNRNNSVVTSVTCTLLCNSIAIDSSRPTGHHWYACSLIGAKTISESMLIHC